MRRKNHSIFFIAFLVLLSIFVGNVTSFYVPGLSPNTFKDGDKIPLYVNKIFSDKTQLPFAYNDLPFVCLPKEGVKKTWLNLGEVLRGDRIANSDIEVCPLLLSFLYCSKLRIISTMESDNKKG